MDEYGEYPRECLSVILKEEEKGEDLVPGKGRGRPWQEIAQDKTILKREDQRKLKYFNLRSQQFAEDCSSHCIFLKILNLMDVNPPPWKK